MRRSGSLTTFVLASALWAAQSLLAQVAPPQATIRITAPVDGSPLKGSTTLRAAVEPVDAVTTVTFFADGQQICETHTPPFACGWDAGATPAEHQIRVVGALSAGGRIVDTIRTGVLEPPAGASPMFRVSVDAVQLTVTVTDSSGRFVPTLPQSAFHVFEDGAPQTISTFAAEQVPLDLVVAVDISTSMTASMPQLRVAVKELLGAVAANTTVTVLAFNDRIIPVATASTDAASRIAAIDRLGAFGATALYDVIIRGFDLLGSKTGRKAMIVFTDGEDEGSRATIAEVQRRLQTSDATLYMIGQGRGVVLRNLETVMRRIVQPTGGRAFFTDDIDELRKVFRTILGELSAQYLLGYTPTNTVHDDRVRRLQVEVDGRYNVRTRTEYRLP